MPNNSLRLKCGRKIIYRTPKSVNPKEPGVPVTPGLGIHEHCCRCKCEGCEAECEAPVFIDHFEGQSSTELTAPWTIDSGYWWYDGNSNAWFGTKDGSGKVSIEIEEVSGNLFIRMYGKVSDEPYGPSDTVKIGMHASGQVAGSAFTLEFYVQITPAGPEVIFDLDVTVPPTAGGGTMQRTLSWKAFESFDLRTGLKLEMGEEERLDLVVCAFESDEQIIDDRILQVADLPADLEFTGLTVGMIGEHAGNTSKDARVDYFEVCGGDICKDWAYNFHDEFTRYSFYDHIWDPRLAIPWSGSSTTFPSLIVTPRSTCQVWRPGEPDPDVAPGAVRESFVTESRDPEPYEICSETLILYPTNPKYDFQIGLFHGWEKYQLDPPTYGAQFYISYRESYGWELWLGTSAAAIPFEPTGRTKLQLSTRYYAGGGGSVVYYLDDEFVEYQFQQFPRYNKNSGIYCRTWATRDDFEVFEFEYYKTTVLPVANIFRQPPSWDGQCESIPGSIFRDDYNGAAEEVLPEPPYDIITNVYDYKFWKYTGDGWARHRDEFPTSPEETSSTTLRLNEGALNVSIANYTTTYLKFDVPQGDYNSNGVNRYTISHGGIGGGTGAGGGGSLGWEIPYNFDPYGDPFPVNVYSYGGAIAEFGRFLLHENLVDPITIEAQLSLLTEYVADDTQPLYSWTRTIGWWNGETIYLHIPIETTHEEPYVPERITDVYVGEQASGPGGITFMDYLCTKTTTGEYPDPEPLAVQVKTVESGNFLYKILVRLKLLNPSTCKCKGDFGWLNTQPAEFWENEDKQKWLEDRLILEAKRRFGKADVPLIRRLLVLARKKIRKNNFA